MRSLCNFIIACLAAVAMFCGCARREGETGTLKPSKVRADLLEGAVPFSPADVPAPTGAVKGSFRSIDWETTGGVVLLSWNWEGPACKFVVYCGDQVLPPVQGGTFRSLSHALWEERGPGIYHYKVVAEPLDGVGRLEEIICGPVVMGRLVWDYDPAAREVCSHFAVYLRKVGENRPPLCIYTAPLPEGPRTEYSVGLRRIFSSDDVQMRVPGERQFLFGATRSAEVATRVNTVLGRPAETAVEDDEVWHYVIDRRNSVTATYCNLTADGAPDKDFESLQSSPVWFTYSRALLYDEE